MNGIQKLIMEYAKGAKDLEKYRGTLDLRIPLDAEEDVIISGMLSDMRYALEWMRKGKRPGNRRGADITDVYRQRELYTELQPMSLTTHDRNKLALILLELSTRERTCFLLHMAHGLTYQEISARLELSKRSIQEYVNRAKSKIQQGFSN